MLSLLTIGTDAAISQTPSAFASSFLYLPYFATAGVNDRCVAIDTNVNQPSQNRYYSTGNAVAWSQSNPAPVSGLSTVASLHGQIFGYSVGTPSSTQGFYKLANDSWQMLSADQIDEAPSIAGAVVSIAADANFSRILALAREEAFDSKGAYRAVRGLYFSSNWRDWTSVPLPDLSLLQPPSEDVIESVQWDGQKFILLVHPGRIFTSVDGQKWNLLPALPSDSNASLAKDYPSGSVTSANTAISVASNGATLVARAVKLKASASQNSPYSLLLPASSETVFVWDGIRWWSVGASSPVKPARRGIFWNGSNFHALGEGEILTSTDGFAWKSHPVPATLATLGWTGSRFFGFTDAFGVLTHSGELVGGEPIAASLLSPRSKVLSKEQQSYTIELSSPTGVEWQVAGLPQWISVTPSSGMGNATLTVSVEQNQGTVDRGAILAIAGRSHLVLQASGTEVLLSPVGPAQTNITIPFSGDWSAAAQPSTVRFSKNATIGKGNLNLTIPANASSQDRTITINVNGRDYTITQRGESLAKIRMGSYVGLLGYVPAELPSADLESYETYEGAVSVSISAPSSKLPEGTYSAKLILFSANRTHVFNAKGSLGSGGSISGNWRSNDSSSVTAVVSLVAVDDGALSRLVSGNITVGTEKYGLLAGKQIFNKKSNPLPSSDAGKTTIFINTFGGDVGGADSGVASATILNDGTVRCAGVTPGAGRLTFSSIVWGGVGSSPVIPYAASFLKGATFLSGYARRDAVKDLSDWDGLAQMSVSARAPLYFNVAMAKYLPPSKSIPVFDWGVAKQAGVSIVAQDIGNLSGQATLLPSARLSAVLEGASPARSLILRLNPSTGIVTAILSEPGSKKAAATFTSAVNQKYQTLDSRSGSILGCVSSGPPGTLSIIPQ